MKSENMGTVDVAIGSVYAQKTATAREMCKKYSTSSAKSEVERVGLSAQEYFKDYCNATAIHGVRYFAEDRRYRIEKIFWALAMTASILMCCLIISQVWLKWDESPVIVSFAESSTNILEVPFPAVTICPETKFRSSVFNFSRYFLQHLPYRNRKLNKNYTRMQKGQEPDVDKETLTKLKAIYLHVNRLFDLNEAPTITADALNFLKEVAPQINDTFLSCTWQDKYERGCKLLRPLWTWKGLCHTFNVLDNNELFTKNAVQHDEFLTGKDSGGWNLEKGYPANATIDAFPAREFHTGSNSGLYLLLQSNRLDHDYFYLGLVQGFAVFLHDPAELPGESHSFFSVPPNEKTVVTVKPSMMTTSSRLQHYAPHRRQCYFPQERKLRFFQVYTQNNCQLECITNLTLKQCGCAYFYMPRDNETDICGASKAPCYRLALGTLKRISNRKHQGPKVLSSFSTNAAFPKER